MGQDVGAEAEDGGHHWQEGSSRHSPAWGGTRKKNAPRWILLGGGDTSAGRSLDTKGEKLSRRAQNSTGVLSAIFTFICTVNKGGFMALGALAPFSYIFP